MAQAALTEIHVPCTTELDYYKRNKCDHYL